MSAEQISELDKRLSIQEVTVSEVLKALKEQTDSTKELTNSVTNLTANLSHNKEETKQLRNELKENTKLIQYLNTEVKIIKSSNRWQEWAGRAIVLALVGAVMGLIFVNGGEL